MQNKCGWWFQKKKNESRGMRFHKKKIIIFFPSSFCRKMNGSVFFFFLLISITFFICISLLHIFLVHLNRELWAMMNTAIPPKMYNIEKTQLNVILMPKTVKPKFIFSIIKLNSNVWLIWTLLAIEGGSNPIGKEKNTLN